MGLKCIISRRSYGRLRFMKTRIACLPPGQLLPGMTVVTPITGAQGSVLLAAGAVLDDHALSQVRRRNIEFVTVSVPDSRDEASIAQDLEAATARVDYIFRGEGSTCGSACRQALRQAVLSYRRKQAE